MLSSVVAMRRRQRQQRWWVRLRSFRIFIFLLLLLCLLLAFAPALLFRHRSNQSLARKCSWLRNRPLVCAHGGDTSRAPPNTIAAYDQALRAKVDCIEIDASRTQDGVLVALHDRDLQNVYGNDYIRVGDLSFKEIVRLDPGQNFPKKFQNQMVPTLVNAIQHVSNYVKQIIIDAKVGGPAFVMSIVAGVVDAVNMTRCKNCLVWSKDDSLVKEFKRLSPNIHVNYCGEHRPVMHMGGSLLLAHFERRAFFRFNSFTMVGTAHPYSLQSLDNSILRGRIHRNEGCSYGQDNQSNQNENTRSSWGLPWCN